MARQLHQRHAECCQAVLQWDAWEEIGWRRELWGERGGGALPELLELLGEAVAMVAAKAAAGQRLDPECVCVGVGVVRIVCKVKTPFSPTKTP